MKYKDCRIIYSPADSRSPAAGLANVVGQFKDHPVAYEEFSMQVDGEDVEPLNVWFRLLREYHSMTYVCGISAMEAHQALELVDEYREFIRA